MRGGQERLRAELVRDGEEELQHSQQQLDEEEAQATQSRSKLLTESASQTECAADAGKDDAAERRVAIRAVSSLSSAVSADGGEAVGSQLIPYAAASAALPAELLPSLDPAFHHEPSALDGIDSPDVPLSDLWQACGYRNLSDLLCDNIVRAFDITVPDSQQAYERLQDMERVKEERAVKYGDGQLPVVTVAQVEAMAEQRLHCFRTHCDSRTLSPTPPASLSVCSPMLASLTRDSLSHLARVLMAVLQLQSALHTALKRKSPSATLTSRIHKRQRTKTASGHQVADAAAARTASTTGDRAV